MRSRMDTFIMVFVILIILRVILRPKDDNDL